MARVGYALGYGKFTNAREIASLMQQAEERGYEMAFCSETIPMRDAGHLFGSHEAGDEEVEARIDADRSPPWSSCNGANACDAR